MSINLSVKKCYESVPVSYLNPSFSIYYIFLNLSICLAIYGHLNVILKKKTQGPSNQLPHMKVCVALL